MGKHRIVVVGASLSGLRTVEALRRGDSDAAITLIGDETEPPYDRPPLSKDLLVGKLDAAAVTLASREQLDALDVELRLGTRALGLDVDKRRVLLDGGAVEYDDVVIATGSRARWLADTRSVPGVHVLRTLDDAVAIRRAFEDGPRVVVIGGGFIGAEVASAARTLGLDVAVVDPLPVLMQRGLGDVVGERATQLHRDAGVRLHLGVPVDGLVGTSTVEGVRLADDTVVAADLVVVGVGAAPNTDWLADSGLTVTDGVVCDEYLAAGPGVHAVGDVARWHHRRYGQTVRMEHWTSAVEHADAVAATLTGTPTSACSVPYVWSDQLGVKLQIAGRIQPGDEVRFLVDEPTKFLAVAGSGGVQHAALAMNAPAALIRQRVRLTSGDAPWPPTA